MVIDAHAHLLETKNLDKEIWEKLGMKFPTDTPLDKFVEYLDQAGVSKTVVMGQDMTRIWHSSFGESHVLEATRSYPERFIGLASIEPLDPYNRLNVSALEYFKKAAEEYGFKGVLLTPPYGQYYSNDKQVYPFYEFAQEKRVIVQFHHSAQGGPAVLAHHKFAKLELLNDVIVDFPDLKINVEHLGYPWCEQLFTLMVNDPNLYSDTAMLYDRPVLLTWNLVKAKEYGVIDRIMYASDYVAAEQYSYSDEPGKDMLRWIDTLKNKVNKIAEKCGWPLLTQEEIDGILLKNAARLYNLKID